MSSRKDSEEVLAGICLIKPRGKGEGTTIRVCGQCP